MIGRIISSIILCYVWIRAIRKIQTDFSKQLLLTGLVFVTNGLLIWSIIWSKSRLQNPTRNISIWTVIVLLWLINSFRYSGRKNIRKIIGPRSIIWSIAISLSIVWYIWSGISVVISYIIMSTCIEEVSKSSLIDLLPTHNTRNLIFHASIIGLAFSIIENIIYQIQRQSDARLRIRTTSVIHIVCSASILYLTLILRNKTSQTQAIIWWLVGWVVLHSLYNRSLMSWYNIITICILISIYPILSYLLYQSDILYNNTSS